MGPLTHFEPQPNYAAETAAEMGELRREVVELQREVREVKDSAAKDARRGRQHQRLRDSEGLMLQWWMLVVGAVVSAILGSLATAAGNGSDETVWALAGRG